MNYISLLTQDEIAILCNLISGKGFKVLFQKKSKEFSKIKPGFRPNGISEKDAVSLGIKYIDKPFISSFVNATVDNWLKEIDEFHTNLVLNGRGEDEAMAETLSKSYFFANINLYFKLTEGDVDEVYIAKIREYMADIAARADGNKREEQADTTCEAEDFREQLKKSTEQLNIYKDQLQSLKDAKDSMEQDLADAQTRIQKLQQDKQEMEAELTDFRARIQYDDTEEMPASIEYYDFDYTSLCEVSTPDYMGQVWLNRLADIRKNGTIEVFYEDENKTKYYSNRSRIFFKDGPNEAGTIGVWNWKSIPNNNDPSRDYVTSEFNSVVEPIEIIVVQECKTDKELIEKMKAGVDVEITSRRVIFAAYLSRAQYVGILCRYSDLEQTGKLTRLNKKVISLPKYEISGRDVVHLSNGKTYYRSISIGIPSEVVNVKDSMDIVKTVILERNSWQLLKQQGITRGEWKKIRDFLDGLDTTTIIDDIVASANCSHSEAIKMLNDFIEYAQNYIDGTSIEDRILSAVIVSNPELMNRCKSLIRDEWIAENQEAVNAANNVLAGLKQNIEQAKQQQEKEYSEAQEKLASIRREYEASASMLQTINADISAKEQLAADVEAAVKQRISRAQNNAADFIANFAFVPQMAIVASEISAVSNLPEMKTSAAEYMCYVQGSELKQDDLETVSTWKEMLDTIASELIEAGVASSFSLPFAAYMYAAYVNKSSLLMVGPNADAIVDAFSGAISGKMAGMLDCTGNYNAHSVKVCYSSEDCVVKIVNPFSSDWIARIPDIVGNRDKFFVAVHPYAEDIQIEPKSLYGYMFPIFTELFVEKSPTGIIFGGQCTENYEDFPPVKVSKSHNKLFAEMHVSLLTKTKMQVLLNNMHTMLNDQNLDYDVVFALFPYAYATMQTSLILNAIQDGEKNRIAVSKKLLELLNGLYGENE